MANTYVSVQQLINASGGVLTPSNVMNLSVSGANWDTYLYDAVSSQAALLNCNATPTPSPCAASTVLRPFTQSSGTLSSKSLQLCSIVSVNSSSNCSTGLSQVDLSAHLNVLQTLVTESEALDLANGDNALNVTNALDITNALFTGALPATLTLTLVQPPQIAYGPVGTTANTGQVNAALAVTIPGTGQVLNIPIAASTGSTVATGTATLMTLICSANAMTSTKIQASTSASGPNSVTLNGSQVATLTLAGAPVNTLGFAAAVVPPTASTQAAGTNPDLVDAAAAPTLSFSSVAGGLNSIVSFVLTSSSFLGPFEAVLQALGFTYAGAYVADLSSACAAVSLVQ